VCHENGKLITGGKDLKVMIFNAKGGKIELEKSIEVGD
jgi:hypothetical protein